MAERAARARAPAALRARDGGADWRGSAVQAT
eukprot:COSAG02_NODE_2337_length_9110_cov_417.266837_5_plen_32_part_00